MKIRNMKNDRGTRGMLMIMKGEAYLRLEWIAHAFNPWVP